MCLRWRRTGTHLVHLPPWIPETLLESVRRPCWVRCFLRSDRAGDGCCVGAVESTAGREIRPENRWDGPPVPWSSASKGLPSLHLDTHTHTRQHGQLNQPAKAWSNHSRPTSARTFGNSLCEAGEELVVLGQSKRSALWLLVEKYN